MSLLSRYGMCCLGLSLPSVSALTTVPSTDRDLLISWPSRAVTPSARVLSCRSLPARSCMEQQRSQHDYLCADSQRQAVCASPNVVALVISSPPHHQTQLALMHCAISAHPLHMQAHHAVRPTRPLVHGSC